MDESVHSHDFQVNPHYLRSFYYAALCKSFTRAADKMWFSGSPAVSQHVRHLESQLGKLFERGRQGVELTPEGRILFELVAPVVEALETIKIDFDQRRGEVSCTCVTMVKSGRLELDFLAEVFAKFRERHPSVEVVVLQDFHTHETVASGQADFGLMGLTKTLPELEYHELLQDTLVLITPVGHPLVTCDVQKLLNEICKYPYVSLARRVRPSGLVNEVFIRSGLALKVAFEVGGGWHDVRKAVSLNMGISIVPKLVLSAQDTDVAVVPLGHEFPRLPWGIGTRRGCSLSLPANDLVAMVAEAVRSFGERS